MKKRFIMLGIVCLFMTGCQTAQKTYSSDISHYLLEHNRAKVQKREIMIDLINYVTLSFDSYNIIKNKEKLISFIDELNYEKYHRLITEKILNNINENVKILY